jgi:UDP-glucose 4-epimerase
MSQMAEKSALGVAADRAQAGRDSRVLVTGGAGYIGSHTLLELLAQGYEPIVLANFSTGRRTALPDDVVFYEGDVGDRALVGHVLKKHDITAVIHLAGSIIVAESVENPLRYYWNNTRNSLDLIDTCVGHGVRRFVFSSTAAAYGIPDTEGPIDEAAPTRPISPYGASKLMTEWMLRDVSAAHPGFRTVALRYFNVAGADVQGRTGQGSKATTHLVRSAVETHLRVRPRLDVFGTDYPTRDGTCERDFIHVSDLAALHLQALDYLEHGGSSTVINCGYGRGATVSEVIAALEALTGERLPVRHVGRRPGDAPSMIADVTRMKSLFQWTPRFDSLGAILTTAIAWQKEELQRASADHGALH